MTQMLKFAQLIDQLPMTVDQIDRLLDRIVTEYAYNPDQKRGPAGTHEGGQFIAEGAMTTANRLDPAHAERLKALRVPPGWQDVQLSRDPDARLQATGVDDKGRRQYLYSAEHSAAQAAEKFERLKAFTQAAPKLEEAALHGLQSGNATAAATYLIAKTGFRVGSDSETGGAVKAYGASTLEGQHVRVDGPHVSFAFTGKKGVSISKIITDPHLAGYIRARNAGTGVRIFDTSDSKIRDFVKANSGDTFKVKDFRTLHGTRRALELIADEMKMPPTTAKEHAQAFARVKKGVAEHLGNTPAVAYASYIDPAVWDRLSTGRKR